MRKKVYLVNSLKRRDRLALVFIQGCVNDTAVFEHNIWAIMVRLEGERVLHPVFIVTLRESQLRTDQTITTNTYFRVVFASMCTTGLLTSSSRRDGLNGALKNVAKLKSLDEVTKPKLSGTPTEMEGSYSRVPDHASVLDPNAIEALVNLANFPNTHIKRFLSPKSDIRNRQPISTIAQFDT